MGKKIVLLHVGTNNIAITEHGPMLSCLNDLVTAIRNKTVFMIVISSILPRPKDHGTYGGRVKNVYKGLVKLCKDRMLRLLHTYRPFLKHCKPMREMFAVRDQSLHLNGECTRRLRQSFVNSVTPLVKEV